MSGVALHTLCLVGAEARAVEMELQTTGGLMQRIILTGLPGGAVREARDRIKGCLENLKLPVPRRSVLVNFAPADLPKNGNGFDLPLALGLLALGELVSAEALRDRWVVGELALDGRLRPIRGGLQIALAARRAGVQRLMLPAENAAEAALVDGLCVEGVSDLEQALEVLGGAAAPATPPLAEIPVPEHDLADVRGQDSGRRALEIAAAGRHNLLLCGAPGSGKTMLARRLVSLLPDLSQEQVIEVTALHGLVATGAARLQRRPPFRAPHHSVSRAGLLGGGRPLVPGELSLAHRGVLFLDEVAEFPRSLLEALRQPMEEREVAVARVGHSAQFPADVQLVAAMNPCPCGDAGQPRRGCRCTPTQVDRYRRRLSAPLRDRLDLHVELPVPEAEALLSDAAAEGSATVARRVAAARSRIARAASTERPGASLNAERGPRDSAIRVPRPLRGTVERLVRTHALSGRAVARLLAVSRTIAALDQRSELAPEDLAEAFSYRRGLIEWSST